MAYVVEIQTIESGRLEWVAVFNSTEASAAIRWGDVLLSGFDRQAFAMKPLLRILDRESHRGGKVIGAWQSDGYEKSADD